MRNKHLVWAYIIILSIGTILSLYIPKNEVTAKEAIVIPNEAIRLRILANSDHESDQVLKRLVRDQVNEKITEWVSELTSIDGARSLLQSKLPEVQEIARAVMEEQGSNQTVKVEFGNVQFPTKLYGQFLYPAGEYEAILITLGEGTGANWWCVLYPPLCFLDFSSGVAVSDGFEEEKEEQQTETKSKENGVGQPKETVREEKEKQQQETKNEEGVKQEPEVKREENAEQESEVKSDENAEQESEVKSEENVEQESEVKTEEEVEQQPEVKSEVMEVQQEETKSVNKKDQEQVAQSKNNKLETEELNKEEPVFVENDEQPVEVKFFVKELWEKLFE